MKMKRFAAMLLAGTMLTGLCACGSSGGGDKTAGSGSSGDELKVSVILKTEASEHWQLIKAGCEQYEKDNPGVKVDVKGPPSETSYDEQTNMIDTDINGGGYDAYVIAPLQSDSVAAQIAATDKPVIALDTNINSDKVVSFVGTGNEKAAKMGAEKAVEEAKAAGWDKVECIEIAGVQGDATNTARMTGYKEGIEGAGGTFLEKETQYADAVADKAVNSMEAIMQTHPEGVAIICANNDDMACAAAKAAKGNKAYEKTIFLGFNGDRAACEAILAGQETMSVIQDAYGMGYKAVQAAVDNLNGKKLDSFIDSGSGIVDKDSAQERLDQLSEYLK